MKQTLLTAALLVCAHALFAQIAYVTPSPTGATDVMTLYIDIGQSQEGSQNNAIKSMLADHPTDAVFLWAWQPGAPVAGNGDWDASNEAMELTHEGGMLYSMTFVPTDFFGVDGPTFFAQGISCLAKLSDGNAYDGEYDGEAKTEDLHVDIIPKLCDDLVCVFPEIGEPTDYIHITYDNSVELNAELQNIDPDQVYLYMEVKTGPFTSYIYSSIEETTSTPELKMEQVIGEPDLYRLVILPEDFFTIPEGETITQLYFYVLTPGFSYTGPPPGNVYSMLECP